MSAATAAVVAGSPPATTGSPQTESHHGITESDTDTSGQPTREQANEIFTELYRQLRAAVAISTRAYCSDTWDAYDFVDMAFMSLYERILAGSCPTNPRAWLITVARRQAQHVSSRRTLPAPATMMEDLVRLADVAEDAATTAERSLERQEIIHRVRDLPERHREVLALFLDGYEPGEVARELGIPRSLARRRLEQAQGALWKITLDSRRPVKRQIFAIRPSSPAALVSDAWPTEGEIERATSLLPPRQREIMRWSRRGYKPGQIAKLLGISANTVRVNLCHARKKLRYHLEQRSAQEEALGPQQYGRA